MQGSWEWHKLELPETLQYLFVGPFQSVLPPRVSLWDLVYMQSRQEMSKEPLGPPYCSRLLLKTESVHMGIIFSCDFHFLGNEQWTRRSPGPSSSPWGIWSQKPCTPSGCGLQPVGAWGELSAHQGGHSAWAWVCYGKGQVRKCSFL